MIFEIPEDVRQNAERLCSYVGAMPSEGNVNIIASAIMVERERCAKIAEALPPLREISPDHVQATRPSDVAAAIRSGTAAK